MRRIAILGVLLLLAATMLVAACGGGDDDDDDSASTPTATATSANNDGGSSSAADDDGAADDDDDSSPDVQGGGSFEGYAADLCTALDGFINDLPSRMDQQQFAAGNFKSLAEPYAELADQLEDARPPDALVEYHASLVAAIRALADAFNEGGADAFARLEDLGDFPTPSEAELQEFSRIGSDIPECRDIGFVDDGS